MKLMFEITSLMQFFLINIIDFCFLIAQSLKHKDIASSQSHT